MLYIVAAPSGGGKTSLVNALLELDSTIRLSISYTTRAPREGEENGVNYHFVDEVRFHQMVGDGAFLEYAKVFGYYYGTAQASVSELLQQEIDVVLEIDWQGAQQVRRQMPACRSIFIVPPSREELERRLRGRAQDSEEVIARRTREAVEEMSHYGEFDFLVVNDDFDTARADLQAIFRSRRQEVAVQSQALADQLSQLLK